MLASLRRTLEALQPLPRIAPAASARLFERIADFDGVLDDLRRTLVDEPPAQLGDGGAIRPEADAELAECVLLRTDARSKLSELEERERERTGIKGLRIKYASAFGYAIEVSKAHAGSVPADYVRKQTLTTGERYVTPELKELELAIATAQTRQQRLEQRLFDALARTHRGACRRSARGRPSDCRNRRARVARAVCGRTGIRAPAVRRRERRSSSRKGATR